MNKALNSMKNICYEIFNRSAVVKTSLYRITGFHPELFTFNRSAVQNTNLTE